VLQLLKDPKFDFMSKRSLFLSLSALLVIASIGLIAFKGLNKGIEFTGGTSVQLKFASTPDLAAIRSTLAATDLPTPSVTTIGAPEENEILVRVVSSAEQAETGDVASRVRSEIRIKLLGHDPAKLDVNIDDGATIRGALVGMASVTDQQAADVSAAILAKRKDVAIFTDWDELSSVPGLTPEILDYLRNNAEIGTVAARGQSYIGPAVGGELRQRAMMAIIGSLIGMLIYIWIRFQLQWGFAAVAALAHDTVLTLGLFSLFGQEMSVSVVAAFLTLVGYSVNDTVVVFDRIRENIAKRKSDSLTDVVNASINQTLSRTIITSGLTWIVVLSLFIWGGAALAPFAFVLVVGVIVGTYSSIYVASPIVLLSTRLFERGKGGAGQAKVSRAGAK